MSRLLVITMLSTSVAKAVGELRNAASRAALDRFVRLADTLAHHAKAEEDVYYPSAILAGRLLRQHVHRHP